MFPSFCPKLKSWNVKPKVSKNGFLEGAGKRAWEDRGGGDTSLNILNKGKSS